MNTPFVLHGHCACGRAEYAAHAVDLTATVCYCEICRRMSGGAGMAWLPIDAATFRSSGSLTAWRGADGLERRFCPQCGAAIMSIESPQAAVAHVAVGTLDNQSLVKGTRSVSVNGRPRWDAAHTLTRPCAQTQEPLAAAASAPHRSASEEALHEALANAPDGFVSIDSRGLITEWNHQAEATLGWTYAEAIRRPLHEVIIPPEMRSAHLRGMSRLQHTGDGPMMRKHFEVDALHKDGHRVPVHLFVKPVKMDGGVGATAFIRAAEVLAAPTAPAVAPATT
ncbi:PAS domain S-box protein [Roseateles sp.]|uniref:GFA family protein n=1 Tax=Roseateles sp. TaxID=1971397 RepID=UPI0031E0090B